MDKPSCILKHKCYMGWVPLRLFNVGTFRCGVYQRAAFIKGLTLF